MMRKTDFVFWTFLMMTGLAAATTVLNVTRTYSANSPNSELYRQLDLFGDVFERVRSDYVEKPDDTMLVESAINGMLAALDPPAHAADGGEQRNHELIYSYEQAVFSPRRYADLNLASMMLAQVAREVEAAVGVEALTHVPERSAEPHRTHEARGSVAAAGPDALAPHLGGQVEASQGAAVLQNQFNGLREVVVLPPGNGTLVERRSDRKQSSPAPKRDAFIERAHDGDVVKVRVIERLGEVPSGREARGRPCQGARELDPP